MRGLSSDDEPRVNPKGTVEGLQEEAAWRASETAAMVDRALQHPKIADDEDAQIGVRSFRAAFKEGYLAALQSDREKLRRLREVAQMARMAYNHRPATYKNEEAAKLLTCFNGLGGALDALLPGDLVDGD